MVLAGKTRSPGGVCRIAVLTVTLAAVFGWGWVAREARTDAQEDIPLPEACVKYRTSLQAGVKFELTPDQPDADKQVIATCLTEFLIQPPGLEVDELNDVACIVIDGGAGCGPAIGENLAMVEAGLVPDGPVQVGVYDPLGRLAKAVATIEGTEYTFDSVESNGRFMVLDLPKSADELRFFDQGGNEIATFQPRAEAAEAQQQAENIEGVPTEDEEEVR